MGFPNNLENELTWRSVIVDERLLAAARSDNVEMILEVFATGDFDINHQDG